MLNELLSENCGKPYEQVANDTDRDFWMRANDAVEYGVVDMVLNRTKK